MGVLNSYEANCSFLDPHKVQHATGPKQLVEGLVSKSKPIIKSRTYLTSRSSPLASTLPLFKSLTDERMTESHLVYQDNFSQHSLID